MTPERRHLDGICRGKDASRGEAKAIGASHASLGVKWKEGNTKHAASEIATRKWKQHSKECPMQIVSGDSGDSSDAGGARNAGARRGTFEDLIKSSAWA